MKHISLLFIVLFTCINGLNGQTTATYNVTFTNFWNATDHAQNGIAFPSSNNPHWSNIVGVNHNNSVNFFELSSMATTGVENIAEIGVETVFENTEVQAAIDANSAQQFFELGDIFLNDRNSRSLNGLQISESYPLITLLTMIAPSPDWFSGVNSLNLRDAGGWRNTISIDLFPYDAGTEDGTEYELSNPATTPQGTIESIQGTGPFNSEKVATLTFTLQSVLSTAEEKLSALTIFPNPANDIISIKNPNFINLKSIEIYSVLGSLSKEISFSKNAQNPSIDVSDLNSGIYLLKLNTVEELSKFQKIVLK